MHGLLIAVASLVAEQRTVDAWASVVAAHRVSGSCGITCAWAWLLHGMWNAQQRLELRSPALAGRFLSIVIPGSPERANFYSGLVNYTL